jgi:PKD repeat protein
LQYLFSLANNDWIFASPGDGTYREFASGADLGLTGFSDLISVSRVTPGGNLYFTVMDDNGILQSPADGTNSIYFTKAQMGLSNSDQIVANHIGLDGSSFFALDGQPDILQSAGDGSNSFFQQNAKLGLADTDQLQCLHLGYDSTIYFCYDGTQGIFSSPANGTNAPFLSPDILGVPGGIIDAFAVLPEILPPDITITNPPDGETIETKTPNVEITYSDVGSGLDLSSFNVFINGVDRTSDFTVNPDGASHQLTDELPQGPNTITASISDKVGNSSSATSNFTVDAFEANIVANPTGGGVPLTVQFAAQVIGGTAPYIYSWDTDGDLTEDDTRPTFSRLYQQAGDFTVTLTVTDAAFRTDTDTALIQVRQAPSVQASANPTSGGAPLTVDFSAIVSDDGTIVLYEWDFNGDGTFDASSTSTPNAQFTYTDDGLFQAAIRVTDDDGFTTTDTVTISVGTRPVASASADPLTGDAPLTVNFTGSATDADGSVVLYEWDFEGDGTFDFSDPTSGNTSHTYTEAGVFNAILRATDDDGLFDIEAVLISVSGPPIALPRAFPVTGEAPLTVTFFSDGEDLDGSPEFYDWDFNGDGTYDRRLIASMNTTWTYSQAGTYNAVLQVTDNEGLTGTASVPIVVTDSNPDRVPTAVASAVPDNGGAPLEVALIGTGTDTNGEIVKYEWDFEGDGTFDWEESRQALTPLGFLIDVGGYNNPVFADIDGDDDADLYIGESFGRIQVFENTGSPAEPNWMDKGYLTDVNGATIDVGSYSSPEFFDADNDGDLDLFIGQSGGRIRFYDNTGSSSAPQWTLAVDYIQDDTGSIIDVGSYANPEFLDADNDGDLDLFIGESGGRIRFYDNTGSSGAPLWTLASDFIADVDGTIIDAGSYANPEFFDTDNDTDMDLLIGESGGRILHYENTGSSSAPQWSRLDFITDSNGSTIDAGSFSAPAIVDIDGDSLSELFIGGSGGRLFFYRNIGTADAPELLLANSRYDLVGVNRYAVPAVADIDGDADLDLILGEYDGKLYLFLNTGDATAPSWLGTGPLTDKDGNIISHIYRAYPALADIDNDGDSDLFVGNSNGNFFFYENTGSATDAEWTPMGLLTDLNNTTIDIGSYSSLVLADIDADQDLDMLIGESGGRIYLIENTGTQSSAEWTRIGWINDADGSRIDVGIYSSPALFDIDADGDLDLFIAEYYGKISLYRNDGSVTAAKWKKVTNAFRSINLPYWLALAIADLDADSDGDLLLGNTTGFVYLDPTHGQLRYTYDTPGQYPATLRVTDNDGFTSTDMVTVTVLDAGVPTAIAAAEPVSGTVPLTVSFTGKGTDKDGTIVLYEWDFDGDGTFDFNDAGSAATTFDYTTVGTFTATLRVTDNDGKQSQASVGIRTTLGITAARTAIFNPSIGETGKITTTLTAAATVTIQIIDAFGNVVRTLVSDIQRPAGTYEDVWDGKDDVGNPVRDGVYYFLIDFKSGDQQDILDLRESAVFKETTPSRGWPSTFNPFEEKMVNVTYSTSKPAEVSMYFWTRDRTRPGSSIAPVRTLILREPRQAGFHTETWDGVDDKGVIVPTGRQYRITLWVYDLPDNAMIVAGNKPVITAVDAIPNYFSPAYNPYGPVPNEYTSVKFDLSKPANLDVKVINADGLVVQNFSKLDLPAGSNTVIWDGKDFNGDLVKEGAFSISLIATDTLGNRSLPRYAAVLIYY